MTSQDQRLRGPARALLGIGEIVLADLVKLALGHGQYNSQIARTVEDSRHSACGLAPHLVVLEMDTAETTVLERLANATRGGEGLPVIALTPRVGDTQLHLTTLEQSLLYLLVANAGRLLTRDDSEPSAGRRLRG